MLSWQQEKGPLTIEADSMVRGQLDKRLSFYFQKLAGVFTGRCNETIDIQAGR